jgi:hypothetical protein
MATSIGFMLRCFEAATIRISGIEVSSLNDWSTRMFMRSNLSTTSSTLSKAYS